jgi:hypothetical protein
MKQEQTTMKIATRIGALVALAITLGMAASPTVQAWGSWGTWQPTGTSASCVSNAPSFTGYAIAYTTEVKTLYAITPGSCGRYVQGEAWPSGVTVTAHSHDTGWYTASTASPTNITKTRCRADNSPC